MDRPVEDEKVDFIEGNEIFPFPTYITRARTDQLEIEHKNDAAEKATSLGNDDKS